MSTSNLKSVVVPGEASESDNEEEILPRKISPVANSAKSEISKKGAVISGEASESEDEGGSISSAVSALQTSKLKMHSTETKHPSDEKYDSLLHKKLREKNISLRTGICDITRRVIEEAEKELTATDQQLLKSQLTLQAAITSLRSLQQNASSVRTKLQDTINLNFLPNIHIPHSNQV